MKSKNPYFRYPRAALAVTMVLLAAGAAFLYRNKPGESTLLPPCLFHQITGFYCAGCGMTRMAYSLLHLDFYQAARCNLLGLLCTPFLFYELARYSVKVFFKRDYFPNLFYQPAFSTSLVVAIALFWLLRNVSIPPFSWLAPINLA